MALGATLGSFRLAASGAVWYRPFNGSLDLDVPFDFAKGSRSCRLSPRSDNGEFPTARHAICP